MIILNIIFVLGIDFGPFICSYFGSVQYFCREPIVPPKELPTECTSFMWDRMIFGNPEWTLDERKNILLITNSETRLFH